jgi:hypothetical protein
VKQAAAGIEAVLDFDMPDSLLVSDKAALNIK